jgi:hypothetical protein
MSDENQTATEQPLTDEQLAEAFPGQDLDHVKSMMGKMDGEGADVSPAADEPAGGEETVEYPEYIPEKFRSGTVEEAMQKLADSYKGLESKLGKPKEDVTSEENSTSEESDDGEQPQAISMRDVEQEFMDKGSISDATYNAMAEKGISREVIDGYIAGQQAIANQRVTKVHDAVGGEEKYADMLKWAAENWSEGEIQAFDSIMKGVDEASIMMAVRGLRADFNTANPADPNLVTGDSGQPAQGNAYESKAEMVAEMSDPRYAKDPAFRKAVEQKIARSNIW